MDIAVSTNLLISQVQQLKPKFPDLVSISFIDFYCQCRQGCDYLFSVEVKQTIRLFDILRLFFDCVERGSPTSLIQLMWNDVVGPTLAEYQADEMIEQKLFKAFQGDDLKQQILQWDRGGMTSVGLHLTLRKLLAEISRVEQENQV